MPTARPGATPSASASSLTGGHGINARLLRHFSVLSVEQPAVSFLADLYTCVASSHLQTLTASALHKAMQKITPAESPPTYGVSPMFSSSGSFTFRADSMPGPRYSVSSGAGVTPLTATDGLRTQFTVAPSSSTMAAVTAAAKEVAERVVGATMALHTRMSRLAPASRAHWTSVESAQGGVVQGGQPVEDRLKMLTSTLHVWTAVHAARIVQGFLSQATPEVVLQPAAVALLWKHEAER